MLNPYDFRCATRVKQNPAEPGTINEALKNFDETIRRLCAENDQRINAGAASQAIRIIKLTEERDAAKSFHRLAGVQIDRLTEEKAALEVRVQFLTQGNQDLKKTNDELLNQIAELKRQMHQNPDYKQLYLESKNAHSQCYLQCQSVISEKEREIDSLSKRLSEARVAAVRNFEPAMRQATAELADKTRQVEHLRSINASLEKRCSELEKRSEVRTPHGTVVAIDSYPTPSRMSTQMYITFENGCRVELQAKPDARLTRHARPLREVA